jgi:ribonuclease HI
MVKGENVAPLKRSAFSIQSLTVNYGATNTTKAPKAEVSCKPPPNHYKMNTDACFFPNGFGAIASVLHNSRGEAVVGRACPKINLSDATTMEAEAIQQDLSLVEGLGVTLVIIESNNLELINACNGVTELWGPYTAIMMECFQISQRIGSISFQFCPREANKVAHNLARCIEGYFLV